MWFVLIKGFDKGLLAEKSLGAGASLGRHLFYSPCWT